MNKRIKPVVQYKDGEPHAIFNSITTTEEYGFRPNGVCKACNGTYQTHGGYEWRYLDEDALDEIQSIKGGRSWTRITKRTINNYGLEV